jgi:hypothetical protein
MSDVLALERRARVAYELGRLKMAARILPWLVALAALGAISAGAPTWVMVSGGLLVLLAVGLRWRNRAGIEDVRLGLQAALLPFIAGVWFCRVVRTPAFTPFSWYGALCVGVGAATGIWVGVQTAPRGGPHPWGRLTAVLAVACLAAALGCADLGVGNLAGIAAGMAIASISIVASVRRPVGSQGGRNHG